MKITSIEIGEYRQFKNINFDFTYPEDYHDQKKVGKPLEKVCFIGQSGTGKTTLLNIIWDFFQMIYDGYRLSNVGFQNPIPSLVHYETFKSNISVNTKINNKDAFFSSKPLFDQPVGSSIIKWLNENFVIEDIKLFDKYCLFIKESVAREADAFLFDQKEYPQSFSDFVKTDTQIGKEKVAYDERINEAGSKKVVSLGDMQSLSTWQYLFKEVNQYDEETVQYITNLVQNTPKSQLPEELQKWLASNPRVSLAEECLNPILNNFFLDVDTDGSNVPIALRTKQGVKVNSSYLSTGTRQLLATAIPLYKFNTKDTVILFDEPERSLFPDIQRGLVNYYTSLAPEAQFFFATHSPIVASAFEPCERFILSFDEDGEVKVHTGIAPKGDDPNDILRQDFGMSPLMSDEGVVQYRKYLDLVTQIKNESDIERKMELIAERSVIGNKYNFSITGTDETN